MREEDVIELRRFLKKTAAAIKIISKIENTEGIECFDDILERSDGIMVARGDMGVEVNYERLPGLQKRLIKKCFQRGKIAITATQMLESMINNPIPTRAEITDVANAVFDGTSAVMLGRDRRGQISRGGRKNNGKNPSRGGAGFPGDGHLQIHRL